MPGSVTALYWPSDGLEEVHRKKDPGGLATAFAHIGRASTLLVSKSRVPSIDGARVIDCGANGAVRPIDEVRFVMEQLDRLSVEDVVVLRGKWQFLLLPLLGRLAVTGRAPRRRGGRARRWILKLDWDGSLRSSADGLKMLLMVLFASQVYDRVVIESTCGLVRLRRWALGRSETTFVPDGCPAELLASAPSADQSRLPVILSVARMAPDKGLHVLVSAFARVAPGFPDWKLHLVGPVESRKYRETLESDVAAHGLGDRVRFLGEVSEKDLRLEYERASIFCSTSFRESFGLARIEAAAYGVPVVTSATGCPKDAEGSGMLVVPIGDAAATSETLTRLMENPTLRQETADRTRKSVLSWEQVAERILS
jgi:glycosyltransferase involved in cell wall biosynthesis